MQGNETLYELAEQAHRLKCLELACNLHSVLDRTAEQVVKDAEIFMNFILCSNASLQDVTTKNT